MKIVESIDEGQTGNWGFRRVVGNDGKVINIEQFLPVYKGDPTKWEYTLQKDGTILKTYPVLGGFETKKHTSETIPEKIRKMFEKKDGYNWRNDLEEVGSALTVLKGKAASVPLYKSRLTGKDFVPDVGYNPHSLFLPQPKGTSYIGPVGEALEILAREQ